MYPCIGFVIFGENKMTGQQLFAYKTQRDFTGSEADEYGQTLMTIFAHIGADLFPLLEEAESKFQRVHIKEFPEGILWDELTLDSLFLE